MPSRRSKPLFASAITGALLAAGAAAAWQYQQGQDHLRQRAEAISGGSATRGKQLFVSYGCGGCHQLNGIPQAHGQVGPPLQGLGSRAFIAGKLENRPDNLRLWIQHPQVVSPGTAMPDLGITPSQTRDLAAFLYTKS